MWLPGWEMERTRQAEEGAWGTTVWMDTETHLPGVPQGSSLSSKLSSCSQKPPVM